MMLASDGGEAIHITPCARTRERLSMYGIFFLMRP